MSTPLLPYRAEPAELRRFLLALARGRTPSQLRQTEFSNKTFDGVSAAAERLGLITGRAGGLSPLGRRFAMASGEDAIEVAGEIVRSYPPYSQLVGAFAEGEASTALKSLEEWWAANGIGGSESNRSEAAPVFARFVEAAGLGRFVQGRKGRVSRIEWSGSGQRSKASGRPNPTDAAPEQDENEPGAVKPISVVATAVTPSAPSLGEPNRISWELTPGRRLVLELPPRLRADERDRVLRLVSLLLEGG